MDETLDVLDGVVFSGGIDIDPDRPTAPSGTRRPTRRRRTATPGSWRCSERALERDVPTLAICRGFQLLNVAPRRRPRPAPAGDASATRATARCSATFSEHPVEVKDGTRLASILGARHDGVQSSHHQGVGRVGEGLVETAWAEDGSLEGLEDPDQRFAVGVLWHPEMEDDKRLFEALVGEARRYRAEKRRRERSDRR